MSSKEDIKAFDPGGVGQKGGIFGMPYSEDEAQVVLHPIPWDVTVSYHAGTAEGPAAILEASSQLDFGVPGIAAPWELKICMARIPEVLARQSRLLREKVVPYLQSLEDPTLPFKGDVSELLKEVNEACGQLNGQIYNDILNSARKGKLTGLVGGDHSCALGALQAMKTLYGEVGVLQVDAHMDLRQGYEGFEYSHASIFFNAIERGYLRKLCQVGIRDFAPEEELYASRHTEVVSVWYDRQIKKSLFQGTNWDELCKEIIADLPQQVYLSIDIDGLLPSLAPGTGTPVPGGLNFEQLIHLLETVVTSGRKIVGFDLCEVAPGSNGDWDGNVGARVLYHLCVYAAISRGMLSWS